MLTELFGSIGNTCVFYAEHALYMSVGIPTVSLKIQKNSGVVSQTGGFLLNYSLTAYHSAAQGLIFI
jgi:hypothetical protein